MRTRTMLIKTTHTERQGTWSLVAILLHLRLICIYTYIHTFEYVWNIHTCMCGNIDTPKLKRAVKITFSLHEHLPQPTTAQKCTKIFFIFLSCFVFTRMLAENVFHWQRHWRLEDIPVQWKIKAQT